MFINHEKFSKGSVAKCRHFIEEKCSVAHFTIYSLRLPNEQRNVGRNVGRNVDRQESGPKHVVVYLHNSSTIILLM